MLIQLLAILFTLVALEGAAGQQIDSPTALVQCAPARLTFSGGVPPYVIDVIPGGEAGAVAMESIEAAASPITWLVDIPAGTNITLRIRDSTGALAFSSPVVVQPGSSDDCIGANASSTSSASSSVAVPSSTSAVATSDVDSSSTTLISTTVTSSGGISSLITSAPSSVVSSLPPLVPSTPSPATSDIDTAPSAASPSPSPVPASTAGVLTPLSFSFVVVGVAFAIVGGGAC